MVFSPLLSNGKDGILITQKALRYFQSIPVKAESPEGAFMPQSMDRSLVSGATRTRRVTREDVAKLKVKSEPKGIQNLFRGFGNFFKTIGTMFSISKPAKPVSTNCNTFGHVMPTSGWQAGNTPRCVDCGKQIGTPTELRNSVWKK